MSYGDQLRHPLWQRKRLEILQRDNWRCRRCASAENTLHVHHLQYVKGQKAWEAADADLVTWCDACHQDEHLGLGVELRRLAAGVHLADLLSWARCVSGDGYERWPCDVDWFENDPLSFAGRVAFTLALLSYEDVCAVFEFADMVMAKRVAETSASGAAAALADGGH